MAPSRLRRAAASVTLGSALFLLNYCGVVSGILGAPKGFEPAWAIRNLDIPQYLAWIAAERGRILLPDYHAPWRTAPALFEPLFLPAARSGLPPLAAFYALHFLLYLVAAFVLLYAAEVFCPGRERWFALAAAACAIPFRLYGWMLGVVFHSIKLKALFAAGMLDYGYTLADGVFRGGESNSPTLTAGTLFILLSMALLARYLQTGRREYAVSLTVVTFVSALLHPFEVFAIVAAALVPLFLRKRTLVWFAVAGAGAAGVLPYFILTARSPWLRDTSELTRTTLTLFWAFAGFGLPCLLVLYLLLIRFHMPKPGDLVLQSWFFAVPTLLFVPGVPFQEHMFNGYAFCVGFLLVRRIACDPQILPLIKRSPRAANVAFASVVLISTAALWAYYAQVWHDGRRADPDWLLSAVRPVSERPALDWIKANVPPDALVLSPPDLAPWVATTLRTSFASHDVFSITYNRQRELAERFFRGDDVPKQLLDQYGVRIALIPATSPAIARMPPENFRAAIGPWRAYEFPSEEMKPYPGIAALDPSARPSFRTRVMEWIGKAF